MIGAWIAGLASGHFFVVSSFYLLTAATVFLITGFICHFLAKKFLLRGDSAVFASLISVFLLGMAYENFHNPIIRHKQIQETLPREVLQVSFTPIKQLNSTSYYRQYIVRVHQINYKPFSFKVLLKIPKDSNLYLTNGQGYAYYPRPGEWKNPPAARLPYGFDYSSYLTYHGIYKTLTIKHPSLTEIIEQKKISPFVRLRERMRKALQSTFRNPHHYQFLAALLLGERQWLDKELKHSFRDAGIMHVLAISGLHIGILLMFLRILFYPLKNRRVLYSFLIISILWLYAALIDFPPSVVRAVLMFSLFQIAWETERPLPSLYLLILAIFFITLFFPQSIYETGFYLSVTAVASIIAFYPLLKKIYYPRNKILRYILDLVYVSIAAQIGLAPLILFYFHRFSFGFIIANILIIPLITIILIVGFVMTGLLAAGISFPPLEKFLNFLIDIVLSVTEYISGMDIFVFHNIYFSLPLLIGSLILVTGIYDVSKKFHPLKLLIYVLIFMSLYVLDLKLSKGSSEVILTHYAQKPVLYIRKGDKLKIYADTLLPSFYFQSISMERKIRFFKQDSFPEVFHINGKKYLHLNGTVADSLLDIKADVLIISGSPKSNMDILLNRTGAREIIVLPGNYPYLKFLWKRTAKERGTFYTDLAEKGFTRLWKKP